MHRPLPLLLFVMVVVSHGDPTAFDDDYRPTDDTSTPVPTANSTVTPAPRPTMDTSRSGFWARRLARCKKASSRCVWTVAIFYFSIGALWCTCICCYGCYEVCRICRAQRKTIPHSDGAFVPGAVEAAAPAAPRGGLSSQL